MSGKPMVLIVLDGWGYREERDHNAIAAAYTPVWDRLWRDCPHTLIDTSGRAVGLPDEQMGNSEVGHMNLGAGRVVYQDLTRIDRAIADGSFASNRALCAAVDAARSRGGAVHIMGLLSPGGVHSHEAHIAAMASLAAGRGAECILVHAFLDGRDTPPRSAAASIEILEHHLETLGRGRIVTLVGRYFAMDRDRRWDRVERAYDLITAGEAAFTADRALAGLEQAYERGESDEFVQPTRIGEPAPVADGDAVVFMNFRADRARQLTRAFTEAGFDGFRRRRRPSLASFTCLTRYAADIEAPAAFPPADLNNSFGEVLALHGLRQLRLAETEKYAHVTFFFNGGRETEFEGEERIMVPSPKVATYDLVPEMSAEKVTDHLVEAIGARRYDAIICNYANPDMVGHTGIFEAAVRAVETIDHCLGRVLEAVDAAGAELLITADHGNVEAMLDTATGQPNTAHTTNLVPLVYVGRPARLADGGVLSDIAPTMLDLMGLEQPAEMTGHSLVRLL